VTGAWSPCHAELIDELIDERSNMKCNRKRRSMKQMMMLSMMVIGEEEEEEEE